jgi:hypothetical protein
MNSKLLAVLLSLAFTLASAAARAEVTIEKKDGSIAVKIDGKLFTEYVTKAGHQPALYPLIGPTDKPITRAYPFAPPAKDETKDHPHHQSVWMNHGEVNGLDFWATNKNDDKGERGPHIVQRELVKAEGHGDVAEIITLNDWMNGDKKICEDKRSLMFGQSANGNRWIDFTITITATNGDVTFGDTKEGSFAIRVADSMRVEAKKGGHIVNSEKQTDDKAWGQPARWVDYSGPVDGETVGITLMSHPKAFRGTPRWHVRGYGLFAANPFGQKDFPPNASAPAQGEYTLKNGESITLKYRLILHKGAPDINEIEQEYVGYSL